MGRGLGVAESPPRQEVPVRLSSSLLPSPPVDDAKEKYKSQVPLLCTKAFISLLCHRYLDSAADIALLEVAGFSLR